MNPIPVQRLHRPTNCLEFSYNKTDGCVSSLKVGSARKVRIVSWIIKWQREAEEHREGWQNIYSCYRTIQKWLDIGKFDWNPFFNDYSLPTLCFSNLLSIISVYWKPFYHLSFLHQIKTLLSSFILALPTYFIPQHPSICEFDRKFSYNRGISHYIMEKLIFFLPIYHFRKQ